MSADLVTQMRALLEAFLPFAENEGVIQGYGFYRPANPNNFFPDPESCSEEEIANHKAACEAFDRGEYTPEKGDGWITPNLHILKAPWGIGSYCEPIPEIKALCDSARELIAKTKEGSAP